jgi:hypothetical protein
MEIRWNALLQTRKGQCYLESGRIEIRRKARIRPPFSCLDRIVSGPAALTAGDIRSARRGRNWCCDGTSAASVPAPENLPPDINAVSTMRWHRESSHFQLVLDNRVLDRVYGRPDDGAYPGMGQRLEPTTLAATLPVRRAVLQALD